MKDITFSDILDAKKISGDKLTEASLGRAYQLYLNSGSKGFAVLTAFRGNKDHKTNVKNNETLEQMIRSWGYGFIKLKGYSREREDNGEWKDINGEPSFWINGITKSQAMKAGDKFEQDNILYSGPETKGEVVSVDLKTGVDIELGKFHPMKIGQYYSRIKGKPFIFEYKAQSMFEHIMQGYWERKGIR